MTVLLLDLARLSARLAATRKRNEKIRAMSELLRSASSEERPLIALYLSGAVRQPKLNVGYAQIRDLNVAPAAQPSLEVAEVDRRFESLAQIGGKGAKAARQDALQSLFGSATEEERKFLAALMLGELRQGALESLLLDAVADAAAVPKDAVRRAQMLAGDLRKVVEVAFSEGATGLSQIDLTLMVPVLPMLAEPAASVEVAVDELGRAAFEYKLDGARIQAHKRGDEVRVFTRGMNEVTRAVPEVAELVRSLPVESVVLDGEVIALRPDGSPHAFEDTMRRFGRRLDVESHRSELPLSTFFFDCLYAEGKSLLDRPTEERIARLNAIVRENARMPRLVTDDIELAVRFFEGALSAGHEGVMAKALDAPYCAGSRGSSWLKIKLSQSLDLVVLAAEWGNGRRTGTLSNLHLGARDAERGTFVMLGKTFKGLTDELLAFQTRELLARATHRDDYTVYVRPEMVVEIELNDVQRSPHYPAGLALRFARVKRYRPDKSAAEASTLDEVQRMYARTHRDDAGSA